MPDYGFIANPQQPDSFRRIGEMVGTMRGLTDLQKARETLQADIEQRKAESSRAVTESGVAAQTAQPRITQSQEAAKLAATEAAKAAQGLTQDQRGIVAGVIGTLGRAGIKDPEVYRTELQNLKTVNPNNPGLHSVIDAYGTVLDNLPKGHDIPKLAVGASQFLLTPQQAQSSLTPQAGTVGMGGTVNQTVTTPSVMGSQPSVNIAQQGTPTTLGPGAVETIENGPDGNKYAVSRSPTGAILSTRPLSQAGAPGAGGAPARMPFISPEDQASRPILEGERNQARSVLSSVPIARETNRGILQEIDRAAATGTPGPALARLNSVLGLKWDTAEQRASSYDLIGKYTERNALEAAKAMGPGTNAGLEAAIKANGSAAYNPTAIKRITKLNDAILSGAEAYQPGLEKAIGSNPERGVLVKREFDQQWAQNFDPRIMEIHNAVAAKDQKTIDEILKQVGGKGSKGANELIRKAANIEALSTTGRLR